MCLGMIPGGMLRQQFSETDRLVAKFFTHEVFAAGGFVTFVEQQVERLQNAIEASHQLIPCWNLKWNLRLLDPLFCARQSLGYRRFSRQESAADFGDAETGQCF